MYSVELGPYARTTSLYEHAKITTKIMFALISESDVLALPFPLLLLLVVVVLMVLVALGWM